MVPEARVRHLVPEGRTTWRYFRSRCWSEGLSKAVMTGRVGSDDGLASERAYVTKTLPSGVAHGVADALRGRPEGLRRAGAIIAGLGAHGRRLRARQGGPSQPTPGLLAGPAEAIGPWPGPDVDRRHRLRRGRPPETHLTSEPASRWC